MQYVIKHLSNVTSRSNSIVTIDETQNEDSKAIFEAYFEWRSQFHRLPQYDNVWEVHCDNGRVLTVTDVKDGLYSLRDALMKENKKVWCEEIHQFTTPEAKGWIEGGCYDPNDLRETFLENIYTDIWNYDSRTKTSDEGVAIVKDGDLADICFDNGWDVRHVRTHDKDEDGMVIEWWEIFPSANIQL